MAALIINPTQATEYLMDNPAPNPANTLLVFQVCGAVNAVLDTGGLNVRQKLALIRQGINTVAKLRLLGKDRSSVQELIKPISTLPLNRGGTEFGINIVTTLAAAVRFFNDRTRLGLGAFPAAFGAAQLAEYEAMIINEDGGSSDSDNDEVDGPGKLKVDDFITWKEGLMIKLRSMKSTTGVPLYYVIRKNHPVGYDFNGDEDEEKLHQIRQNGHEWNKDNKRVAQYILSLVQPTDGYEWVRMLPKTDGRTIFETLVQHYQGDNAATTISQAYQTIDNLKYVNQYIFSWEVFSTRIKKAYDRLEENNIVIPTSEKLRVIKSKINTRNIEFNMLAKSSLTYDANNAGRTLTEYMSKVAEHVAAEFPNQQGQGQRFRPNVGMVHAEDDAINTEVVAGRTMCNGVDITDKVRKYPHHEWVALPFALRQEIMDAKRNRGNTVRNHRGRGRGGRGSGRSVSTVMTEEGMTELIQRTTQATIASLQVDDVSIITTPTAVAPEVQETNKRSITATPQGTLKRVKPGIGKIQTSNVRQTNQPRTTQVFLLSAHTKDSPTHTTGYFDEDSHADMHCAGKNCVMLSTTGFSCDVSPFHDQYDARKDVEIVKSATAYQHDDGQVTYLIMNISLWFGDEMEHSLFNGLIARDAGNNLCTDPYDERGLGFDLQRVTNGQDLRIAMQRRGNTIGVQTFKPCRDDVLRAIDTNSPNVIYLNPEAEYPPINHDQTVSAVFLEEGEVDLRPRLSDMPFDADEHYHNAVAPSDEAPLLWPHQLYNIAVSMIHDVKRVVAVTTNQIQGGCILDYSYPGICAIATTSPHRGPITPETLQKLWGIGHDTAMRTIDTTTQHAMRHATQPLRRRYRTDLLSLLHSRVRETVHTDTLMSQYVSIRKNICAQVYATESGVVITYPMTSKGLAGETVTKFCREVGIPSEIFSDNAKEFTKPGTEFQKAASHYKIKTRSIEPHTPRQNKVVEGTIGLIRKRWLHIRQTTGAHPRLWDYAVEWISATMSRTYREKYGRTGMEVLTGDTPDISNYTDFAFYDRVWFWKSPSAQEPPQPGRWIGVANDIGTGTLGYWVIDKKGQVYARTSVQCVMDDELKIDTTKKLFDDMDDEIRTTLDGDRHHINTDLARDECLLENAHDDAPEPMFGDFLPNVDEVEDNDGYDEYVGARMLFDLGGEVGMRGTVVKRAKGNDGTPIGTRDNNPILDTRRYTVQLMDGSEHEFAANQIAENLYSQVNEFGQQELLFREIVNHRNVHDIKEGSETMPTRHGQDWKLPKTTKGVEIQVRFRDESFAWLPMNEVRQSNPIELAEYAVQRGIANESAFAWWVPYTLRCRRRMISKIKSKYWVSTHKFGIELPKSVEHAYRIDKETGTTFWHDAIEKEMKRIREAMQEFDGDLDDAKKRLIGYQQIRCHMIFDVKMEGLVRKARYVAGGHTTETPKSLTYASVVTRESVRIGFLIAALNDLEVMAADIGNAYLNADCREKIYFVAGPEFGSKQGRVLIIKKALYGLKSSGAAWRSLFSATLHKLNYRPCRGDPDVYIRRAIKPSGVEYYEMLFVYVDDILHISHHKSIAENETMRAIGAIYALKEDSLKPPEVYLGANIGVVIDSSGTKMSYMSATDYIGGAIKTVEASLPTDKKLNGHAERPFPQAYKPELDATPFLDENGIQLYQGYIGILRWIVELGRIDIMVEISQLSSFLMAPREGHMQAALSVFAYLRKHRDQIMLFNPARMDVRETDFTATQWADVYGDVKEEVPIDFPEPLGPAVCVTAYVDADHAGNMISRRSQTGFIIFINSAPIIWYSKKQNTIESSTFGAEFVALRICTESLIALRYKLRSFGIVIDGPADVYCDNGSVVKSASVVEGRLNKKHLAICYHRVRECCAMQVCRIAHVKGDDNLADIFTKVLATARRTLLIQCILRYFRHHT